LTGSGKEDWSRRANVNSVSVQRRKESGAKHNTV
jgi:hypothetical protein